MRKVSFFEISIHNKALCNKWIRSVKRGNGVNRAELRCPSEFGLSCCKDSRIYRTIISKVELKCKLYSCYNHKKTFQQTCLIDCL